MSINFGTFKVPFANNARFVSALHSSSLPDGSYGGNPGGFIFSNDEGSFYYAGDTALTMEMNLVPMLTTLKFAVLPIGGNFTMDAEDALMAADMIKCDHVIGVHYDTFPPIKINTLAVVDLFKAADKELSLPAIGQTIEL